MLLLKKKNTNNKIILVQTEGNPEVIHFRLQTVMFSFHYILKTKTPLIPLEFCVGKFLSWLVMLHSEYDCENTKHDLHLNTILNTKQSRHHLNHNLYWTRDDSRSWTLILRHDHFCYSWRIAYALTAYDLLLVSFHFSSSFKDLIPESLSHQKAWGTSLFSLICIFS